MKRALARAWLVVLFAALIASIWGLGWHGFVGWVVAIAFAYSIYWALNNA